MAMCSTSTQEASLKLKEIIDRAERAGLESSGKDGSFWGERRVDLGNPQVRKRLRGRDIIVPGGIFAAGE